MILTERDHRYYEYIRKFGFSTLKHMVYALNITLAAATRRMALYKRNNYLVNSHLSTDNREIVIIPGKNFNDEFANRQINHVKLPEVMHEWYLLMLYTAIIKNNLANYIEIERDKRLAFGKKSSTRIPDLVAHVPEGFFIIEYERSEKSWSKVKDIYDQYSLWNQSEKYFLFICETENISNKLKTVMKLRHVAYLKPKQFLGGIMTRKYETLIEYVKDPSNNY